MRIALQTCILAVCISIALAKYKTSDFTEEERWEATLQGIEIAKQNMARIEQRQLELAKTASSRFTSAQLLSKFFRKASPISKKMGKGRLMIEDAVSQAERILLEKKRLSMAPAASKEEQAEVLAQELYHKPGSILSKKEYAHIFQESECEGLSREIDCSMTAFVEIFRNADGRCNNLQQSTQGAAFTAFSHLLPPDYEDGINRPRGFQQSKRTGHTFTYAGTGAFTPPSPSARLISDTIIRDEDKNDTDNTHLIMQWGQFMDHDLDLAVETMRECDLVNCVSTAFCLPIRVPEDDQEFGVGQPRNGSCLPFVRTLPACPGPERFAARVPVNELTHYIDGSMVYGSTQTRQNLLREFEDGLLKVGENNNLPEVSATPPCPPVEGPSGNAVSEPEPEGGRCCPEGRETCFIAGDIRVSEHVSLTVMHTIWVREHNRIAAALKELNPQFDDERLFQDARNIVVAQIQQITYNEYLPAVLGQDLVNLLIGPYDGYSEAIDSSIPNGFATAAYRFGHSQIQANFDRLNERFLPILRGALNLRDSFMNPQEFFDGGGVDPMVRGWITQPARALDEFLNSVLTTQLFEREEGMGMDLATLNIQRSRDHGIPSYNVWKNFCFKEFGISSEFTNELTKIRLLQLYGTLDSIDLWVGGLAEEPLPGAIVGATFACIFAITFQNLRDGDRFWYENTENNVFSAAQLAQIRRTTFARVLCDNSAVGSVQLNPFLLEGTRQGCGLTFRIPGINFAPWDADPLCFIKTRFEVHSQDVMFSFYSHITNSGEISKFPFFRNGSDPAGSVCAPIECPTDLVNTQVFIFADQSNIPGQSNFANCQVTQNPRIPANSNTGRGSLYASVISSAVKDVPNNGLFKDRFTCLAATENALTYNCEVSRSTTSQATATKEDLESELAHILQGGDTTTKKEYSQSTTTVIHIPFEDIGNRDIPLEVLDMIRALQDGGGEAIQEKIPEDKSSKTLSTDQLVDLLQATLQELKHKN